MITADPEIVELDKLDADWAIPCDYSCQRRSIDKTTSVHDVSGGGDQPAEWVIYTRCPNCGHRGQPLGCTPCKDLIMSTGDTVQCGRCGDLITPYRHIIERVEPLQKRGAA